MAVVMVWLSGRIQEVRRSLITVQLELEDSLSNAVKLVELRGEVQDRQAETDEILSLLPDRSSVGDVVSAIEAEARHHHVSLTIPTVGDAKQAGEDEVKEEPQFKTVTLQVVAIGRVLDTLNFFHAVEHLPYVLQVESWHLSTDTIKAVPGTAATGPPGAGSEGSQPEQEAGANLTMQINLKINDGSKN